MGKTKNCAHCHQSFIPCRNPEQYYCGNRACQTARKCLWRKQKHTDPDYRENQRRANQAWHHRHPGYWKKYRTNHPSYTEHNREQQHSRDQRRKLADLNKASHLAKSDALPTKMAVTSGTYHLVPLSHPHLAKSDALMVKISVLTSSCC